MKRIAGRRFAIDSMFSIILERVLCKRVAKRAQYGRSGVVEIKFYQWQGVRHKALEQLLDLPRRSPKAADSFASALMFVDYFRSPSVKVTLVAAGMEGCTMFS